MKDISRKVHIFDNGIKVYADHLMENQKIRYTKCNLHEPEEEGLFIDIIKSIQSTKNSGCFINIGSAVGYYPLLAKKHSKNIVIHAFEPLKLHRQFFLENIFLNGFNQDEFNLYEEGISSVIGSVEFIERSYGSSIKRNSEEKNIVQKSRSLAQTLLYKSGLLKNKKISTIHVITLDSFLDKLGNNVELCQMDIQGLEVDALMGAKESLKIGKVKTFLIGTHGEKVHHKCIAILKNNNYEIEFEETNTVAQPDGIIVASKGVLRLKEAL
jgi:FkbM family methyltransferase